MSKPTVEVTCQIPGSSPVSVQGDAEDTGVVANIRRDGHYEGDVMRALFDLVRPHWVCIDGGGNIGVLAMALARYASDGRVYSFEPGQANFEHLKTNVANNGLDNVEAVPLGLWDEPRTFQLNVDPSHPGGAFVSEVGDGYTAAEVIQVVRLDDWVAANRLPRVDLVKLDVEGAEPQALAGALRTIARHSPHLLVEFNPSTLQTFQGHDPWHLFELVRERFRSVHYIREDGSTIRILGRFHAERLLQRKGYLDLLCSSGPRWTTKQWRWEHIRAAKDLALLVARFNPLRPSPRAYLYRPSYDASLPTSLSMAAGARTTVPVQLRNTSDTWFDSDYEHHPVHASYHWLRDGSVVDRDGERTRFRRPLGPGRSTSLALEVVAPSTPGRYELAFSLVQERFHWCDELRPELAVHVPVEVT